MGSAFFLHSKKSVSTRWERGTCLSGPYGEKIQGNKAMSSGISGKNQPGRRRCAIAACGQLCPIAGRDWLWGSILVIAVVLAYLPVWHAGFIWDDDLLITANPCIDRAAGASRKFGRQRPAHSGHRTLNTEHLLAGACAVGSEPVSVSSRDGVDARGVHGAAVAGP